MVTVESINALNEQLKSDHVMNWNFISLINPIDDVLFDTLFGPFEKGEHFIIIQPTWIMAHVVHAAGCFGSVGDARKNGWNKPIPELFNKFEIGKKKTKIWTFINPIINVT